VFWVEFQRGGGGGRRRRRRWWRRQRNLNKIKNITDLQQNNNWNVMTIENVLNNNRQHPVNTAS